LPNPTSSLNRDEVEKFSAMADSWWSLDGPFGQLHRMNPIRIQFILDNTGSLKGKKLLDIGCGGGIASVPFARAGAIVTAIDASPENIAVAKTYIKGTNITIDYRHTTAEEVKGKYDIITCLEVAEHVDNLSTFLKTITSLLAPGGTIFISTINRTLKSYLAAIIGAEYVLRWVPRGTHDWNKFIKPSELCEMMLNMQLKNLSGMILNPISNQWHLGKKVDVNYIAAFSANKIK